MPDPQDFSMPKTVCIAVGTGDLDLSPLAAAALAICLHPPPSLLEVSGSGSRSCAKKRVSMEYRRSAMLEANGYREMLTNIPLCQSRAQGHFSLLQ